MKGTLENPRPSALQFPIIGIGASAGGLSALQTFFENMPNENGMAFVVILHLSPAHESNAAAILQRYTKMPVTQVREKIKLQAEHVYVIPPTHALVMDDGCLALIEREIPTRIPLTIDIFFRTLAQAHRHRAIAIVLSGMGSDGAAGLAEVKAAGGVTLAQLADDAEYRSMPLAATANGAADIVLPVAEMPQRLIELWNNAKEIRLPPADAKNKEALPAKLDEAQRAETALEAILALVSARTGHDFRSYKRATVLRRLERRLQVRQLADLPTYYEYLSAHSAETPCLLQDMLISVTNFFRDRDCFDALEREVLPALFSQTKSAGKNENADENKLVGENKTNDAHESIRAWVAGCATGEEAYSVAILLHEFAARQHAPVEMQLFATDIDEQAIAVARAARYSDAIINDIAPLRLQTYFSREHDSYRVIKTVRETVLFAVHNILRDPPFLRLDLICCRNLLIYLNREAQRYVLEMFHTALKPGGYLFLGTSETDDATQNLFTVVDKKNRIYRRNSNVHETRYIPSLTYPRFAGTVIPTPVLRQERRRISFAQLHRQALEEASPASVLIDNDYSILHLAESAAKFLERRGGEPSHNLLANIHPDLRLELRMALFRAVRTEDIVDTAPVQFERDGKASSVAICVRHFKSADSASPLLLVIFNEIAAVTPMAPADEGNPVLSLMVNHLENEITRYKEDLQTTIERSEISNEELKAANEELQAVNEELRSTTEELETSKEELQSINEELITVNHELKAKIEETHVANDYLYNFIASTDIATVFIDKNMRIVRFTPRATEIFKLIESNQGRVLTDIRHELDYDALPQDARAAFSELRSSEREIKAHNGKYYLARALPYRIDEDRVDGAVLTFIDITALHQAQEQVRIGEARLRLAAKTIKEYAILTIDEAGFVANWNAGAERAFGYSEEEMIGKSVDLLLSAEDRNNGVFQKALEQARTQGRSEEERWYVRKNGTSFFGSGVLSVIGNDINHGYVKVIRDMTGNKRLDAELDAQLLREKTRAMQIASDMKDEFLAIMSHELKHPLNLINVNAELLAHMPEVQHLPNVTRVAQTVRRTALSQAKIIDDLLDLSRVRTGKLTLSMEHAALGEIIAPIVHAGRAEAAQKSITVEWRNSDESLICLCDIVRVEQIVWNLLSNAIRYTPVGGKISVVLSREAELAKISVADTGEGIAPSEIATVFGMFTQGFGERNRRSSGMGIGLALVKEFAEAHGGRVVAESPGLGKGATFSIWLPLACVEKSQITATKESKSSLEEIRTLIVDDSRDALDTFATLLRMVGAVVETAESGAEALRHLDEKEFDLLISDIGMPEMDGYQLAAAVRCRPTSAKLPLIALTGYGSQEDAQRALSHGFNAHLSKPVSLDELKKVVALVRAEVE